MLSFTAPIRADRLMSAPHPSRIRSVQRRPAPHPREIRSVQRRPAPNLRKLEQFSVRRGKAQTYEAATSKNLALRGPLRNHTAVHMAERLCRSREALNGRQGHWCAICGGAARAFPSQAADSVSAMSACARALRCVFIFSTSPAQKQ